MRKKLIFISVVIILGLVAYNYIYQDHRDIGQETPDFTVSGMQLAAEFVNASEGSEQKYIDRTILVHGQITELNASDLTIDGGVFCQFNDSITADLKFGSPIILKGRCIGFDDLLEQVKLNECTIIKK